MNLKRTSLSTAFSAIVGSAVALAPVTASAIIPDGHYRMVINDTPYNTAAGRFVIGTDGNWNSSFTFGCYPGTKGCISQAMYDSGLSNPNGGTGSGIAGDGVSGILDITVSGGTFTVDTFNKDVTRFTAGGDFFQYTKPVNNVSQMGGTITGTTMVYDPTNRLGSITSPALTDKKWNVDDCTLTGGICDPVPNGNTDWLTFQTTTASNTKGTITGTPLINVGDVSGSAPAGLGMTADGRDDFVVTLVTGGAIGSDWGGFFGAQMFEIWNNTILSLIKANDDADTTNAGITKTVNLTGNDTTPFPPLAVASVDATSANGGTVVDNGNGTADYTPAGGFAGVDTFTYTISDADPGADPSNPVTYTDTATVTMTVNAGNQPNAVDDSGNANQNASGDIDVTDNDTTPVGVIDPMTVVVTTPASNGGTAVNGLTGVVTYTPVTDFTGLDTFGYTVDNDLGATSNEATVTVTTNAAISSSAGIVAPGAFAIAAGSTNGKIAADDVPPDDGVEQQCVGGCYDFTVSGLAPGSQVDVFLIPLSVAIPAGDPETTLAYRKLQGTWGDFDLANVSSGAPNANGACSSNIGDYTQGLNTGDTCLSMRLEDGSLAGGDADGNANGTIEEPGGIGVKGGGEPEKIPALGSRGSFDNNGCTIGSAEIRPSARAGWWLIAGFLAWLGWSRRKTRS